MVNSSPKPKTTTIELPKTIALYVTQEQFTALAAVNQDLRLERNAQGELVVNPPTGWETGKRNWIISGELYLWWRNAGQPGKAFDSSTGFILPNGAICSPDASWVSEERWQGLKPQEKETFANICPNFVLELRSNSDSVPSLQAKMREYIENGALLGWLIDPFQRQVEIYYPDRERQVLENPGNLSGEGILPGFILNLSQIWQ